MAGNSWPTGALPRAGVVDPGAGAAHHGGAAAGGSSSQPIEPDRLAGIEHALIRLETGQTYGREMTQERVAGLQHHLDTRITELRHDMGDRMDRIEDRLASVEHGPSQAPHFHPSSPPTDPAATPWWQDMSPRERLLSILGLVWLATAWLRPDLAEQLISALPGQVVGLVLK